MNEEEQDRCFLMEAFELSKKSSCLRFHFGAVLVDQWGEVIGKGYNGFSPTMPPCQKCFRDELKIAPGTRYETCRSIHAEQMAVVDALENRATLVYATMYVAGEDPKNPGVPANGSGLFRCTFCARWMDWVGIEYVVRVKTTEEGWEPLRQKIEDIIEDSYRYVTEHLDVKKDEEDREPGLGPSQTG